MAGGGGKVAAALVLSAEERAYLEQQVRRRRVARSLSERCRMILRCADGLTSKAVAAELGMHEHTVGKWRRRFATEPRADLEIPTDRGSPRASGRRGSCRSARPGRRSTGRRRRRLVAAATRDGEHRHDGQQ